MKISRRRLAHYGKTLHQKACCTCSTIIFLHSTNQPIKSLARLARSLARLFFFIQPINQSNHWPWRWMWHPAKVSLLSSDWIIPLLHFCDLQVFFLECCTELYIGRCDISQGLQATNEKTRNDPKVIRAGTLKCSVLHRNHRPLRKTPQYSFFFPKNFAQVLFLFSHGTIVSLKRNWKQCLCKIQLGGQTKIIMVFSEMAYCHRGNL